MSIVIDAMLIYGVPYSEIPDDLIEEVDKLLDNRELDYASPYYDSPRSEWIVGKEISCYETTLHEVYCGIIESGDYLYDTILQKCETKIYVSPHVT
jgi:hypothetical protein